MWIGFTMLLSPLLFSFSVHRLLFGGNTVLFFMEICDFAATWEPCTRDSTQQAVLAWSANLPETGLRKFSNWVAIIVTQFFSPATLDHDYASPYQVWSQKVDRLRRCLLDRAQTDRHGDSSIPLPLLHPPSCKCYRVSKNCPPEEVLRKIPCWCQQWPGSRTASCFCRQSAAQRLSLPAAADGVAVSGSPAPVPPLPCGVKKTYNTVQHLYLPCPGV